MPTSGLYPLVSSEDATELECSLLSAEGRWQLRWEYVAVSRGNPTTNGEIEDVLEYVRYHGSSVSNVERLHLQVTPGQIVSIPYPVTGNSKKESSIQMAHLQVNITERTTNSRQQIANRPGGSRSIPELDLIVERAVRAWWHIEESPCPGDTFVRELALVW
jgi:hypothetical protein